MKAYKTMTRTLTGDGIRASRAARRNPVRIGSAVVVALTLALAACGGGSKHSSAPTAAAPTTLQSVASSETSPTSQDPSSSSTPDSSAGDNSAMLAWATAARPYLQSFVKDFNEMSTDATDGDAAGASNACDSVQTDVEDYQQNVTSAPPDAQVAADLQTALSDIVSATRDGKCESGIKGDDLAKLNDGVTHLDSVAARVNQVTASADTTAPSDPTDTTDTTDTTDDLSAGLGG